MTALGRLMARSDDDIPVRTPRVPAREAAERELSDPRYHQHDPNPIQQALDWLWERIGELFSAAAGTTPGGWIGLLAIAASVVLLLIALRLRLGAVRRTPTTSGALFAEAPRTAAEHRSAADRHAAEGRWNQAIQDRMRALVLALEERTLLTPGPGRTADEASTEAGRAFPAHADRLRTAARTFDDVTYGGRPGTEEAYTLLTALDTDLQHAKPDLATTPTRSRG
ncbi:DUF4129 domain-containing protein [Streptomyces caniferus]|uniref:DUF4129 domain-containing protein n=1 Tax=Streptomyces caniferus TaxID=285557 RepID=A0A640SIX6_9ACTN|nr:DUF4129 domain-containing protein [Streptomyces caniferus]GFE10261.1 membrane protein [Streptomyces caniferus]